MEKSSGLPVHGVLPAIGGNRKDGRATNGTSPCKVKTDSLSTVWSATTSAVVGLWKGVMTRTVLSSQFSVLGVQLRLITVYGSEY